MVYDGLFTPSLLLYPFLAISIYFLMNIDKMLSNLGNGGVCLFEVGPDILLMLIKGLYGVFEVELDKADVVLRLILCILFNHEIKI